MNNTFNINRFGKILRYDGLNFFPNFILALAILWAIPVVVYLFTILMPTDGTVHIYDAMARVNIIDAFLNIAIIIAPAMLYKTCNDSRKGIGYAMLPASTLEKFVSMVVYCVIVTPIVYIAGSLAIDSILALFNGPYDDFAASIYFDKYEQIAYIIDKNNLHLDDTWPLLINRLSPTFMTIISLLSTLSISSIFMFGNMIFKKRKTGKMIGILIFLSIIFMIVFINYVVNNEVYVQYFEQLNEDNVTEFVTRMICIMMNVALYANIIVSALLLFVVYRKIKTQKY